MFSFFFVDLQQLFSNAEILKIFCLRAPSKLAPALYKTIVRAALARVVCSVDQQLVRARFMTPLTDSTTCGVSFTGAEGGVGGGVAWVEEGGSE